MLRHPEARSSFDEMLAGTVDLGSGLGRNVFFGRREDVTEQLGKEILEVQYKATKTTLPASLPKVLLPFIGAESVLDVWVFSARKNNHHH